MPTELRPPQNVLRTAHLERRDTKAYNPVLAARPAVNQDRSSTGLGGIFAEEFFCERTDMKNSPLKRRTFLQTMGSAAATTASLQAAEDKQARASDRPIRVGLIGCGGRGTYLADQTARLKAEGERVEIAAVCDIYQPRLERAAARFGATPYTNSNDLLASSNLDAVIVATPDRWHVPHSLAAVRSGKDVYCEKPLSHWKQFDQLKELVQELKQRKAVFQVGAQRVSSPMWSQAGERIRAGALGKITHAQTGYFRHGDGGERGMPIDDPAARPGPQLDWDAFQGDAPKQPFDVSRFFQWRMYLDYSGGPSTDLYPHPMTRLFKALGVGLPKKVVAVGGHYFYDGGRDVPDTFDLLIEYPSGLTVAVLGTITNDTGLDTVIRGTEVTLRCTGDSQLVLTPQPGSKQGGRAFGRDTTVQDHLRDYFQCIRSRQEPRGNIQLGYAVQVPLIMGMLSWHENEVAFFDESKQEIRLA